MATLHSREHLRIRWQGMYSLMIALSRERACDQHTSSRQKLQERAENVGQTRMAAPHKDHKKPCDPPQRGRRNPALRPEETSFSCGWTTTRSRPSSAFPRPEFKSLSMDFAPVASIVAECTSNIATHTSTGSSLNNLRLPELSDLTSNMPPKRRHRGISRSVGFSIRT